MPRKFVDELPGRYGRSRTSHYLILTTFLIVAVTIALPYTLLTGPFGFCPLPWIFLLIPAGIVALYIGAEELAKHLFYLKAGNR